MNKKTMLIIIGAVVLAIVILLQISKHTTRIVVVERDFNAPVEKVWQIWTDAESMKKWWSPKSYTAPVIKNDLREGGSFLFSMQAPDGKTSWNTGKYTEVIPQQKIVSMMSFADEAGNVVPAEHYQIPGKWPNEVKITAEFKSVDGKTRVIVTEEGIPMVMYVFAKMGWEQQFDKFETLLQ